MCRKSKQVKMNKLQSIKRHRSINILFIKQTVYISMVSCLFIFFTGLLIYYAKLSDWHDFDVFYSAAKAALQGESIYITVGKYNLPFWYFPWTAWFFIPFAIWSYSFSLFLYKLFTLMCSISVIWKLSGYYRPHIKFLDILLIISLAIPMSLQLIQVGQMDYILLWLIVIIIFLIDQKKDILAGLLIPFIWIKPHLLIVFTFLSFFKSGYRTIIVSVVLTTAMFILETIISPTWYFEMLSLLKIGSQRIDGLKFTTFPSLLGFQENWVGTANLPFTILLIVFALIATWRLRNLPTVSLLTVALTASVFCAPRAYAYDLPLLIPGIIWLSYPDFKKNSWIWFVAAFTPLFSNFESSSYLVTLLVFLMSLYKANQLLYKTT